MKKDELKALTDFAQAAREDYGFSESLKRLAALSPSARAIEFERMATAMEGVDGGKDLARVARLLQDDKLFKKLIELLD